MSRRITSRTYYVDLALALPKDEPAAGLAARALVLLGDILFERDALTQDDGFEVLDKLGPILRRTFFFRSSLRSLYSAIRLLNAVRGDPSFQAWLRADPKMARDFDASKKALDRNRELLDRLRNAVGGHTEDDVGRAVQFFEPGTVAPIERHAEDHIRPRLAAHILLATIIEEYCQVSQRRHPRSEPETTAAFDECIKDLSALTGPMISALHILIFLYGRRYPLFSQLLPPAD